LGAYADCLYIHPRATAVLPGLYGAEKETPLLLDQVVIRELNVQGVFFHDFPAVNAAI
jgi:hypothetical protein